MTKDRVFPIRLSNETIKQLKLTAINQNKYVSVIVRELIAEFLHNYDTSFTNLGHEREH